ncbi:MAG: hypothetical protein LBU77_06775 [Clostridiales bacterium]|jgi:hypothetical protein|nr:hypothetical protein [Clostridiales bacterium]
MSDMTNIAYTPEYQAERERVKAVFTPENLQDVETIPLLNGYSVTRRSYYRLVGNSGWGASESIFYDSAGQKIYEWYSADDDAEFVTMFTHSNGRDYVLFRIDLYGYGVYDLTDKKDFFYVPKGPETFIWTEAHYCVESDVLAVSGCFWAAPNNVIIVDFREPMRESKWIDLLDRMGGYDVVDEVDFIRWSGDSIVIKAQLLFEENGDCKTMPEERMFTRKQYMAWF